MKVLTVVGARPQFVKAAPVSRALREAGCQEILVHTGQHYDREMSEIFFRQLHLSDRMVNLDVGSASHGVQTGTMLIKLEEVLLKTSPDIVFVFGDTNSTLAGALAACKLGMTVAHIEAGLRSRNRAMPEEHNRILTDHCADILFCPTPAAVSNLNREGLHHRVHLVGDTMLDAVMQFSAEAAAQSTILKRLNLSPKSYLLATVHRPYSVDDPVRLKSILGALIDIGEPIVFPVHPRTRSRIETLDPSTHSALAGSNLRMIEPVGYLDMLMLETHARLLLTDSGGLQKEAYFCGVPCVTLRPETEWVELVELGVNRIAGHDPLRIVQACREMIDKPLEIDSGIYGDGHAAERIVKIALQPSNRP